MDSKEEVWSQAIWPGGTWQKAPPQAPALGSLGSSFLSTTTFVIHGIGDQLNIHLEIGIGWGSCTDYMFTEGTVF